MWLPWLRRLAGLIGWTKVELNIRRLNVLLSKGIRWLLRHWSVYLVVLSKVLVKSLQLSYLKLLKSLLVVVVRHLRGQVHVHIHVNVQANILILNLVTFVGCHLVYSVFTLSLFMLFRTITPLMLFNNREWRPHSWGIHCTWWPNLRSPCLQSFLFCLFFYLHKQRLKVFERVLFFNVIWRHIHPHRGLQVSFALNFLGQIADLQVDKLWKRMIRLNFVLKFTDTRRLTLFRFNDLIRVLRYWNSNVRHIDWIINCIMYHFCLMQLNLNFETVLGFWL